MPGVVTRDLDEVRRAFIDWLADHLTARGVEASELDVELTSFAAGE